MSCSETLTDLNSFMIVSEQQILDILERFEQGSFKPEEVLPDMQEKQPYLYTFIFDRPDVLLSPEEADLLTFGTSVIWAAVNYADEIIYAEEIEDYEETAWERLEASKSHNFHEKITPFFDQIDEEELLAFVEDSLADDDDTNITATGREWIFVSLGVMIEVLCA